jgi:hypothetical protein
MPTPEGLLLRSFQLRTLRDSRLNIAGSSPPSVAICNIPSRLAEGASGVVRSDILLPGSTPHHITQTWEVRAGDVRWTDALYPLAQEAMRRGYYMPNRNSIDCSRHHCPYWRRCEQDFGGTVEP